MYRTFGKEQICMLLEPIALHRGKFSYRSTNRCVIWSFEYFLYLSLTSQDIHMPELDANDMDAIYIMYKSRHGVLEVPIQVIHVYWKPEVLLKNS